jgi:hypothetical protein
VITTTCYLFLLSPLTIISGHVVPDGRQRYVGPSFSPHREANSAGIRRRLKPRWSADR